MYLFIYIIYYNLKYIIAFDFPSYKVFISLLNLTFLVPYSMFSLRIHFKQGAKIYCAYREGRESCHVMFDMFGGLGAFPRTFLKSSFPQIDSSGFWH